MIGVQRRKGKLSQQRKFTAGRRAAHTFTILAKIQDNIVPFIKEKFYLNLD